MLHMLRIHSLSVRSDLLAEALQARFSRGLRRTSMRISRVEATKDLYRHLYGQSRRATDQLREAEEEFLLHRPRSEVLPGPMPP